MRLTNRQQIDLSIARAAATVDRTRIRDDIKNDEN